MTAGWIALYLLQWVAILLLFAICLGVLREVASVQRSHVGTSSRITHPTGYLVGEPLLQREIDCIDGSTWASVSETPESRRIILVVGPNADQATRRILEQVRHVIREASMSLTTRVLLLIVAAEPQARELVASSSLGPGDVAIAVDQSNLARDWLNIRVLPTGIAINERGGILSQSANPHAGWLFEQFELVTPEEFRTNWIPVFELRD